MNTATEIVEYLLKIVGDKITPNGASLARLDAKEIDDDAEALEEHKEDMEMKVYDTNIFVSDWVDELRSDFENLLEEDDTTAEDLEQFLKSCTATLKEGVGKELK